MSRYTEKTVISREEYVSLAGLLALGRDVMRDERRLVAAVAKILGEDGENGHAPDAIYSEYSVDDLLQKSGITVAPEPAADAPTPQ